MLQPPWLDGGTSNFQIFCVYACVCVRQREGERDSHGEAGSFLIKKSLMPEVGKQ